MGGGALRLADIAGEGGTDSPPSIGTRLERALGMVFFGGGPAPPDSKAVAGRGGGGVKFPPGLLLPFCAAEWAGEAVCALAGGGGGGAGAEAVPDALRA